MLILYEILMLLGFVLYLPRLLYLAARFGKYRTNFFKRFGKDFPKIERGSGPIIWVHAVSVGECQAVVSLIEKLKSEYSDATIVISSLTETGHAEAKRSLKVADYHVYLPFDFYFVVRHVLSQCTPDLIILSEGDYWYQFLHAAKKRNSAIAVVNGKISNGSQRRLKAFPFFTHKLFSLIDLFCLQNDLYKDRFRLLGVPLSKIKVTGNLKCDAPPQPVTCDEYQDLKKRLFLKPTDLVLVIGSTHDPEEDLLLKEISPLFIHHPNLKVVLVPRHLERIASIKATIEKYHITYGTWTMGSQVENPQLMLLDAMGLLRKVYQIADLAIVAGSFTSKVGGHNIFEAQCYGVPVIVGPYMHTQESFLEFSKYYDAIVQVQIHELRRALDRLIMHSERRKVISENSIAMCHALQGATTKTLEHLKQLLACRKERT